MDSPAAVEVDADWASWPWMFVDPSVRERMPTFAVAEVLYTVVFLSACAHASLSGRKHVALLVASFFGGIGNDVFFMWIPVVDNFWHAQGMVMVTPRFPLYIAFIYIAFLYIPTTIALRLGLSKTVEPLAVALFACSFYAGFDVVGAKFLWWTWHETDTPLLDRVAGVPVASTMWVAIYSACFAFIVRRAMPTVWTTVNFIKLQCIVFFTSVPLMMVIMMVIQCLYGMQAPPPPPPNRYMLCVILVLSFFAVMAQVVRGWGSPVINSSRRADLALWFALLLHYITLASVALGFFGNPESHKSVGVHQTQGPCGVETIDYSGQIRHKYICNETPEFDFCGHDAQSDLTAWYPICGKPMDSFWQRQAAAIIASGAVLLCIALISRSGRKEKSG